MSMDSSPAKTRSVNKLFSLKLQLEIFSLQTILLNNCDSRSRRLVDNSSWFGIDLEKSVCIIYRRLREDE